MTGLPSRSWRLGELDWTRAHGIPINRSTLEPDDEITDLACAVRGDLDTLAATPFDLVPPPDGAGSVPHGTEPARGQT